MLDFYARAALFNLMALRGHLEGFSLQTSGQEHLSESKLTEIHEAWQWVGHWTSAQTDRVTATPLRSGLNVVNTFKSAPGLMPVKEGVERELAQLVWDGTCSAWGRLEAAGVAVMNDVTAGLEAMREELLQRFCEALQHEGGSAGNDSAHSLMMIVKVAETLGAQSELIQQAESQWGPLRQATEHPLHAICSRATDNLIALQRALSTEFSILQLSQPNHPTASDLQEMKEHLKEPLSASSDWGRLWEDPWWRDLLLNKSGVHFDSVAKNEDLSLTPVKELIQVSQAIKDRHQAIPEETAPVLQAERDTAQKEIRELKARCDDLEERYEALKSSLNAEPSRQNRNEKQLLTSVVSQLTALVSTLQGDRELAQKEMAQYDRLKNEHEALKSFLNAAASKAFAHRAWCGHGGISSASPASLSSWNVVASGSGGSQTILSTSWISVATSGPCCFLTDAIFKIKKEDGFDFCEAKDLQMGSKVVAENGEIIEAKTAPEHHVVHEMVELQTESACLQVSPDHRIVRPDKSAVPRLRKLFPCGSLCSPNRSHRHESSCKLSVPPAHPLDS